MPVSTTSWVDGQSVPVVLHTGYVVGQTSVYVGDCDSSYSAIYFDVDSATFKEHCTGYAPSGIVVDAPAEIMAAYEAEVAAKRALAIAAGMRYSIRTDIEDAAREAATPWSGKTIQVVKGRKVAKGTVGVVKVRHDGPYGWSVLLTLTDGTEVWTSETNVEVVPALVAA